TENVEVHTPVAFLSRFEKFYLEPTILENLHQRLVKMVRQKFSDHPQAKFTNLFVGFVDRYTFVSLLINSKLHPKEIDETKITKEIDHCYQTLLKNTSLPYMLQDVDRRRNFTAYADILDILEREGADDKCPLKLVKIGTHDFPLVANKVIERNGRCYTITTNDLHSDVSQSNTKEEDHKYSNEEKERENKVTIVSRDVSNFIYETDFFNFICGFFAQEVPHVGHYVWRSDVTHR
ncbi:hypothetical protein RFI_15507, partial [Reticulomyxa filosa]